MALGPVASKIEETGRKYLRALGECHGRELQDLQFLDAHYQGTQPLSYMAPELVVELGDRMRQVVIHWPELVIDSLEERLDVEGFQLGGEAEADERLWSFWQANGLDSGSHQAHVDALVMKRAYIQIGSRSKEDVDPSSGVGVDVPLMTWESPLEMFAARDPRTRRVMSAAKWWDETPLGGGTTEKRAALFLPRSTSWWVSKGGQWCLDEDGTAALDEHDLGVVPVVPLVNRPRTSSLSSAGVEGWSDLEAVIPLSDAACKSATDLMVASEYHALPRRYMTGIAPEDITDGQGNPVSALSRVAGRVWAVQGENVTLGQFPESSLSNFHDTIELLASIVASVSGLPPHYLGSNTQQPASADAIRSSEARLVKRAERKQRAFGEAWEQVMRIALLVADGEVPAGVSSMETKWRDASTPTIAQSADAAVKKFATKIVPRQQTWSDLGYTATQQKMMQMAFDEEAKAAAAAFGLGPDPQMPGDNSVLQDPATAVVRNATNDGEVAA